MNSCYWEWCSFEVTAVHSHQWMLFTNCYITCMICLQEAYKPNMCQRSACVFVCIHLRKFTFWICLPIDTVYKHVHTLYSMCARFHCVNVCEFLPQIWGFFTLESACADRRSWAILVAVLWSQRGSRGDWYVYQSLPLCLCAFVWWPSKTSIAILASHRIGLLYKNTPASILQGWSGAEGVGAAEAWRKGYTKYSSEISLLHPAFWVHFIP